MKKERNSLIELYRFLMSILIVLYHDFFFVPTPGFYNGNLAVSFFFLLSGFYLVDALDKSLDGPIYKIVPKFIWIKLKKMGIPLLIGYLSVLTQNFLTKDWSGGIMHYLWYVHIMMIMEVVYLIIRKYIKNQKIFYGVVAYIMIIAFILRFVPELRGADELRGIVYISMGMLIPLIPDLKLNKWINYSIQLLIWVLSILLMIKTRSFYHKLICECLLFPILMYLSTKTYIRFKLFDYLGSLSLNLYTYQCFIRLLLIKKVLTRVPLFILLVVLAIVSNSIIVIIKKRKKQKNLQISNI